MANRAREVTLSADDRSELEGIFRASSSPSGLSRRARAVLLLAAGETGVEVASKTGYTTVQVNRIRRRFVEEGMKGLVDQPRNRSRSRPSHPELHRNLGTQSDAVRLDEGARRHLQESPPPCSTSLPRRSTALSRSQLAAGGGAAKGGCACREPSCSRRLRSCAHEPSCS